MQQLYFTPAIEDIRVGYECFIVETSGKLDGSGINKVWTPYKVEDSYDFNNVWDLYNEAKLQYILRTAYLTKEQIIVEGWKLLKKVELNRGNIRYSDNNFLYFSKGELLPNTEYFSKFNLRYKMDDHTIHIISKMRNVDNNFKSYIKLPTFYGKCPSINEFRIISKLLNI